MKAFVDTNVLIDVLARRKLFYEQSSIIWSMAERNVLEAYISAISFNNSYYIVRRLRDRKTARKAIILLRDIFQVVSLDESIVNQAIDDTSFKDFEDAIQYHSAVHTGTDFLITRNPDHFSTGNVSIVTPDEFCALRDWTEEV